MDTSQNIRWASLGMEVGALLFLAGATALFTLSRAPEGGWTLLGCGGLFLATAVAVWWMGRGTDPEDPRAGPSVRRGGSPVGGIGFNAAPGSGVAAPISGSTRRAKGVGSGPVVLRRAV
jgi:hypothetical protein